jgi:hypothetical protein
MKKIGYVLLLVILVQFQAFSQSWETVGIEGYTAFGAQYPDLAIYNGVPYVAFKDAANAEKCTVMKYIGSSWVIVGTAGFSTGIARNQSIAIDQSNGDIYVAYSDADNGSKTTVMKYSGSTWQVVGTVGFSAMAGYQSLIIDNGTPYVAFEEYYAKLMKFNGTTWEYVGGVLPGSMDQVWYTNLAMYNHSPYVVYRDIYNSSKTTVIHLGTNNTWEPLGTPAFSDGDSKYQSIAIDNNGIVYVAYQDVLNGGKATVKKYENSSWTTVGTTGFTLGTAISTNIEINNGVVYLSFIDESEANKITVMKLVGQNFVPVGTAGLSVGAAYGPKLAFDNDITFVSYADVTLGNRATVKKFTDVSSAEIEEIKIAEVSIHPNPVKNHLTVESNVLIEKIQILDFAGKIIKVEYTNEFSVEDLSQGLYFINLHTSKGLVNRKFVKE